MSASQGFGAASLNDGPVSFSRTSKQTTKAARSNGEFLRQSCADMSIAIGPRNHEDCPHGVTAQRYAPNDSAALATAISAAYRQCTATRTSWTASAPSSWKLATAMAN